jgi:hypothetical protein
MMGQKGHHLGGKQKIKYLNPLCFDTIQISSFQHFNYSRVLVKQKTCGLGMFLFMNSLNTPHSTRCTTLRSETPFSFTLSMLKK